MAEGGSDQERSTEDLGDEISQHRLEEYRNKGMVSQSREITGLLALLATGVTAYTLSPRMGVQLSEFMREIFSLDLSSRKDLGSAGIAHIYLIKALMLSAVVGLPICLAGLVMGVVGSFVQIGTIWSTDPLTPDFNKVNPISGFQRLVSMKTVYEGLRILLKLIVLGVAAYALVKSEILHSSQYVADDPSAIMTAYGQVAKGIFFTLMAIMALFAGIDFAMQKFDYNKQLRLTKQEAKQEHKEREGDPQIKARIRAAQREVSRRRMMQAVKKATVIVTNPTHFAIAIYYEPGTTAAPKVVAKGADFMAQKIKSIAAEAGVPIVENVPLARTLYKTVKVNHPVPRALYQAVAEVLAYVYRLKGGKW